MSRSIRVKLRRPHPKSPWTLVAIRWRVHAGNRQEFNPARIPMMGLDLPLELAQQLHAALGEVLDRHERQEAADAAEAVDKAMADLPFMGAVRDEG